MSDDDLMAADIEECRADVPGPPPSGPNRKRARAVQERAVAGTCLCLIMSSMIGQWPHFEPDAEELASLGEARLQNLFSFDTVAGGADWLVGAVTTRWELQRAGDLDDASDAWYMLQLARQVQCIQNIPIDDAVCESPHARLKRIMGSSTHANWPYHAATLPLNENLVDYGHFTQSLSVDPQQLWDDYKTVAKLGARRLQCRPHITKQEFHQRVYEMHHLENLPLDAGMGEFDVEMPEEDFGGDAECQVEDDGAVLTDYEKLLAEFLKSALLPSNFYSIRTEENGETDLFILQVLEVDPKHKMVKTFAASEVYKLRVAIRHYETWRFEKWPATELNVFLFRDVIEIDMVSDMVAHAVPRANVHVWQLAESKVEGCLLLRDPKVLAPPVELRSPKVPVLCLVDALAEKGFESVQGRVEHKSQGSKQYDGRKLPGKRFYLQCVLLAQDLFKHGAHPFNSTQSQAFYQLLLKAPKRAQANRPAKAKEHLQALANMGDDDALTEALAIKAAEFTRARLRRHRQDPGAPMPLQEPLSVDAGQADDDIAPDLGDATVIGNAQLLPDEEGDAGDEASSTSSSSNSSSDSDNAQAVDDGDGMAPDVSQEAAPDAVTHIYGSKVKYEFHWKRGARTGMRIDCPNCDHRAAVGCSSYRSLTMWNTEFGERAAALYLSCWAAQCDKMSPHEHKKWRPTKQQVREHLGRVGFP